MWPDLGIAGATWIASPSTWMPGTANDSNVRKSTSHQSPLAVASPASTAMAAARIGGTTFKTSACTVSPSSNCTLRLAACTATASNCGVYSMMSA
ncbi:hypothetical protein D3C71_1562250 [compost metagenome]